MSAAKSCKNNTKAPITGWGRDGDGLGCGGDGVRVREGAGWRSGPSELRIRHLSQMAPSHPHPPDTRTGRHRIVYLKAEAEGATEDWTEKARRCGATRLLWVPAVSTAKNRAGRARVSAREAWEPWKLLQAELHSASTGCAAGAQGTSPSVAAARAVILQGTWFIICSRKWPSLLGAVWSLCSPWDSSPDVCPGRLLCATSVPSEDRHK